MNIEASKWGHIGPCQVPAGTAILINIAATDGNSITGASNFRLYLLSETNYQQVYQGTDVDLTYCAAVDPMIS